MTVHQENFVATKEYESQYLFLCDKPQCFVRRHTLSALQSLPHQLTWTEYPVLMLTSLSLMLSLLSPSRRELSYYFLLSTVLDITGVLRMLTG